MSLDFALKDFYRKRRQNFPFVITIALTVAVTIFLIYFSDALNLNYFISQKTTFSNPYFFSGSINIIFTQFNTVLMILVFILALVMVTIICASFIVSKKRDITIMKALGTLPEKLYNFYLLESYIIFLIGFFLGWILGISAYGIVNVIFSMINFPLGFEFDFLFSLVLFFICSLGALLLPGLQLRKMGGVNVIKSFSKDLPADYDASSPLKLIPKWISSLGLNVKYAVVNLIRKKRKFQRFFIVFFTISLILFTIGLGALVLNSTTSNWIEKSQGDNIIIIGHQDVVNNYSSMYRMFSDPNIFVNEDNINFTKPDYLFNFSQLEQIRSIKGIKSIDQRLIHFSNIRERKMTLIREREYIEIGNNTEGVFPIIGLNSSNLIQDFEIEGNFFDSQDPIDDNVTIGDGLAYNFFEYALDQEMVFVESGERSHVSGIVIDTFYSGYSAYMDINQFRSILNLTNNEINIILLKIDSQEFNQIEDQLASNITLYLGSDFTYSHLDDIFNENLSFLTYLSSYSLILILLTSIVSIFSLYHFQKGDLSEKLKDFLIMHSIGSKLINIGKILFLEGFLILVPAIFASLAGGMIINTIFLFERVSLPPLHIPFLLVGMILGGFSIINFFVLIPLLKRIKHSSLRELKIF